MSKGAYTVFIIILKLNNVLSDALNIFVGTTPVVRMTAKHPAVIALQLVSAKSYLTPIRLCASRKDVG